MTISDKKIIVVVGGTGRIGSSVALSLHDNPTFHVKVTSRDVMSARAARIKEAGIELVQADSWNAAELKHAFRGAWGVWLNTNSEQSDFIEQGRKEFDMGKTVIDTATEQGVKVFVFAGLPDSYTISNGAIRITSFDHKSTIADYGRKVASFESFVNVNVGWMMENFWNPAYEKPFGGFARVLDSEGYRTLRLFAFPNTPSSVPLTSIRDDYGDIVHGVFLDPLAWDGQVVWAVSDPISFQQVTDTYNKVCGKNEARFVQLTEPVHARKPSKAKEVNGVRDYTEYVKGDYCGGKPVDLTLARTLKRAAVAARGREGASKDLQTFEGFVRTYGLNGEDM